LNANILTTTLSLLPDPGRFKYATDHELNTWTVQTHALKHVSAILFSTWQGRSTWRNWNA